MPSDGTRAARTIFRVAALAVLIAFLAADWILFSQCVLPSQRGGPTVLADGMQSSSFQAQASLASGGISLGWRSGLGQGWEAGIRPSLGYIYAGGDIDVKKHLLEVKSFHLSGGLALASYFSVGSAPYTRLIPEVTLGHPKVWMSLRNPWLLTAYDEESVPAPFLGGALGFQLGSTWRLAGEFGMDFDMNDYGNEPRAGSALPFGGLAVFYHFGNPPPVD